MIQIYIQKVLAQHGFKLEYFSQHYTSQISWTFFMHWLAIQKLFHIDSHSKFFSGH